QQIRKITPEQNAQVIAGKIRDAVLDLFLWEEGAIEFVAGGVTEADRLYPLLLDLRGILREGATRRARWREMRRILPDSSVRFVARGPWPAGFPKAGGEQLVVKLIERGRSMQEIQMEMH